MRMVAVDDDIQGLHLLRKLVVGDDPAPSISYGPGVWISALNKGPKASIHTSLDSSCREALDLLSKSDNPESHRVLVCDLAFRDKTKSLPFTGYDVIEQVRQHPLMNKRIGIFALTGWSTFESVRAAFHAGADGVISKGNNDLNPHASASEHARLELFAAIHRFCWYRGTMKKVRTECKPSPEWKARYFYDLHDWFVEALSRRSLSQHLHHEWDDTLYALELAILAASSESERLKRELTLHLEELRTVYDWRSE